MAVEAREYEDVRTIPLGEINVADPHLFQDDTVGAYFARLRREDPVHFCSESRFGPYWSVTMFNDIMAVDTNHRVFSSEAKLGGIAIQDMHSIEGALDLEMFIAMDQPKHDQQRKVVSPVVAPSNLLLLEPIIRERAGVILDSLPVGEEIDWVKLVSVELTTMTLATIFDFPWDERAKLTRWSDITTASPETGIIESFEQRREELIQCAMYFKGLWDARIDKPGGNDLISMMANSPATRDMPFLEFLGNLLLHHPQFDQRGNSSTQSKSCRIRQIARPPRTGREHGSGDNSMADTSHPYAAHRVGRRHSRGQANQTGR